MNMAIDPAMLIYYIVCWCLNQHKLTNQIAGNRVNPNIINVYIYIFIYLFMYLFMFQGTYVHLDEQSTTHGT
jgi:hypothetical protein